LRKTGTKSARFAKKQKAQMRFVSEVPALTGLKQGVVTAIKQEFGQLETKSQGITQRTAVNLGSDIQKSGLPTRRLNERYGLARWQNNRAQFVVARNPKAITTITRSR
jgi:hypothetical protein